MFKSYCHVLVKKWYRAGYDIGPVSHLIAEQFLITIVVCSKSSVFFSFYCKWQLAFSIIVNFFLYSLWRCFYLWIPWICIPLLTMLNRMCRYLMGHCQINANPFLQLWVDFVWYDTRCYFNVRSKPTWVRAWSTARLLRQTVYSQN